MEAPPLPETVLVPTPEERAAAPGAAPLAVLVPLGIAAALLAIGLFVPIRKGFGLSAHLDAAFFKDRLWHAAEAAAVPIAAGVGAVLWWVRPRSRFLVSGVLIGLGVAAFLRNLQILIYAGLPGSPGPGVFLRLLGAVALGIGGVLGARAAAAARAAPAPAAGPAGPGSIWPWFLGAGLVVPAVVLPFAKVPFLGRSLSIIGPDDTHRAVYAIEPLGIAALVLAGAAWWLRGRPDRRLVSAVVTGLGAALFLHFLWYAMAPVLLHPITRPLAGGFLGLASAAVVGVGGWRAHRWADRAGTANAGSGPHSDGPG